MPTCSVCGKDFPEEQMASCSECGAAYCLVCTAKEPSMEALGVCSDCEEAWAAEEDLDDEI